MSTELPGAEKVVAFCDFVWREDEEKPKLPQNYMVVIGKGATVQNFAWSYGGWSAKIRKGDRVMNLDLSRLETSTVQDLVSGLGISEDDALEIWNLFLAEIESLCTKMQ